jgi:hypothetical protein
MFAEAGKSGICPTAVVHGAQQDAGNGGQTGQSAATLGVIVYARQPSRNLLS